MSGNGQAVLIARATGYDSLFSDQEMVFFDSLEELTEAVATLAADKPRGCASARPGGCAITRCSTRGWWPVICLTWLSAGSIRMAGLGRPW